MNIVLLTWNPVKFAISERQWERRIRQVSDTGCLYDQWSTGNSTKLIQPGDVAFLLRQTRDRGIVAKGEIISEVFEDEDWQEDSEETSLANYVEIKWTEILPIENRLDGKKLEQELPDVSWVRYSSGTTVENAYHARLLEIWAETVNKSALRDNKASNLDSAFLGMIHTQNGLCGICGLNSIGMYGVEPAEFLNRIEFSSTNEVVAACPSCCRFQRLNPKITSRSELDKAIQMFF